MTTQTVITWRFENAPAEVLISHERLDYVILSNGAITVMIPQRKMYDYMEQILNSELRHGF
jgi:hypothetical protein